MSRRAGSPRTSDPPPRCVLFDAVGTILRPAEPVGDCYARIARTYGASLEGGRVDRAFREVLRRAPPMAFPEAPAPERPELERRWWHERVLETLREAASSAPTDFDAYFDAVWQHYSRPGSWALLPGAREALELLERRGDRLAMVSNFDHRLHRLLEGLSLRRFFEHVVLPADVGAAKPDPQIFLRALALLGGTRERAVYVGDDPVDDVSGAHRAGLRAIDVRELATLHELPARILQELEERP